PEITGLIVAMVGITVIRLALMNFLGLDSSDQTVHSTELLVAFVTLGLMVGLNVWSKGKLKLFCVLIGMVVGYLLAYATGMISSDQMEYVQKAYLLWFPFKEHPGWSFKLRLLLPFLIAMLCSTLKSVGDLTTCQKINDAEWKRTDMDNISKGILADSAGCISAGILGGMGQSTSSTNIGLSIATGVTSRIVAYAMGFMLIVLGFFPKVSSIFAIMPKPVLGATIIFAVSYMIVAGFQIIMSRMIDARKTFIIGISLIFGLAVDLLPDAFAGVPSWIFPIFSSSLSTATITAVFLNLLFKIGISKKVKMEFEAAMGRIENVTNFIDKNCSIWGARNEVVAKSKNAVIEFLEAVIEYKITDKPIQMQVSFDEFNLDIVLNYHGELLDLPHQHPDTVNILGDKKQQLRLSGFLLRHYCDKITGSIKDGTSSIHLHFEH
ncbi:purine/pyrimidine permease, partial [candidate division KSB1 bacterium]|nr:purine/pyrimidine permease [candidate division KSB1 bacterium]